MKPVDLDWDKLCTAVKRSRLALRKPREERREAVRQAIGFHWSEEGADDRVPCNLIGLYQSVLSRSLIAKSPRVLLSTSNRQYKPVVGAMQLWCNREIERTNVAGVLQRVVVDALYSVGICKVALAKPAEAASMAWKVKAGRPFVERVDLDDFVFDIHARDFDEVSYIGHRVRVPLEAVRGSKFYSEARKKLSAAPDKAFNAEGDERIQMLGRSYYDLTGEEFEDHVDLWEIYLPRHRLLVTFPDEDMSGPSPGQDGEPLAVEGWIGPDSGPYHMLGLETVPGNAMPKGPIQNLVDLHEAANRVLRKLIRTIDRTKEVTAVRMGAAEDGSRLLDANDGDMIRCDDPTAVNQIVVSGQHLQQLTGTFTLLRDLFSWAAGNLDAMGGLSPQAKTLGQEQLLAQNSSRTVADMQERTVEFVASVMRSFVWYSHYDPHLLMEAEEPVKGGAVKLARRATPQQRRAVPFESLDCRVDPYSLVHQTPQGRLQQITEVVQSVVLPLMPLLVQRGIDFDVQKYLQKIGEYMDQPDLDEIVKIGEPMQQGGATSTDGQGQPQMPGSTRREYVRRNVSEATQSGTDRNMIAQMMTGKSQGGRNKPQMAV